MAAKKEQKIGIMGGTFDPIHFGHLLIAQSALDEYALDKVIFIPTGKSPHKDASMVTDASIRCKLTALAIADNPNFVLSNYEANHTDINYTYKTLAAFAQKYPNSQLYFIMGEDSIHDFTTWRKPEQICQYATLLVAVRNEGYSDLEKVISSLKETFAANIYQLKIQNIEISSSMIRQRIKDGKSVRYMLPKSVQDYITAHQLYQL